MKELQIAMKYKHKPTRDAILEYLSNRKCVYKALQEISLNILNNQIKLNKNQIQRLNSYVKTIKRLKCGVKTKKVREKLVKQSGGFLPWLLPIVATAISSLL